MNDNYRVVFRIPSAMPENQNTSINDISEQNECSLCRKEVILDFLEVQGLKEAVASARAAGKRVRVTMNIFCGELRDDIMFRIACQTLIPLPLSIRLW